MAAREAEQTEREEETDGTDIATDNQLSEEDTVETIKLGKEHNAPLDYDPGLELHQPSMSKIWDQGGQ